MGKHKKEEKQVKEEIMEVKDEEDKCNESSVTIDNTPSYEDLVKLIGPIASPLASKKLTKRLLKVVRKSGSNKHLKRGVREVVKSLRKDVKGIVVLAGDVSPVDVISHIPVYCEEKHVPYCYVPSRRQLGAAGGTKRPTSVVLVQHNKDYDELYKKCYSEVDAMPLPL